MINIINPARFSEVIAQVDSSSEAALDRILSGAQSAFETWSRTTPEDRASRLKAAAKDLRTALPELATLFVRENGKTLREAEIDVRRSIELMELIAADLPEWWKPSLIE